MPRQHVLSVTAFQFPRGMLLSRSPVSAELMPDTMAIIAAVVIVVSSALYFADRDMKTKDNHFRGFPGLWSAAAFYLILVAPPAWLVALVIAILVVATFLNFPFIHPLR